MLCQSLVAFQSRDWEPWLAPGFVNKILLEHRVPFGLHVVSGCFQTTPADLGQRPYDPKSLKYSLHKHLLTPVLFQHPHSRGRKTEARRGSGNLARFFNKIEYHPVRNRASHMRIGHPPVIWLSLNKHFVYHHHVSGSG